MLADPVALQPPSKGSWLALLPPAETSSSFPASSNSTSTAGEAVTPLPADCTIGGLRASFCPLPFDRAHVQVTGKVDNGPLGASTVIRTMRQADVDAVQSLDQQYPFPIQIPSSHTSSLPRPLSPSVGEQLSQLGAVVVGFVAARRTSPTHVYLRPGGGASRKHHGDDAAILTLHVEADNEAAQTFYTQLGFRIVGRRRGFYTGLGDAFEMSGSS